MERSTDEHVQTSSKSVAPKDRQVLSSEEESIMYSVVVFDS